MSYCDKSILTPTCGNKNCVLCKRGELIASGCRCNVGVSEIFGDVHFKDCPKVCCDGGLFGESHECMKQEGEPVEIDRDVLEEDFYQVLLDNIHVISSRSYKKKHFASEKLREVRNLINMKIELR